MAKGPISNQGDTTPTEFASALPRDLHPTSDIRFVIVEVTKLSTLVERLISDVKDQGGKIDDLRHQATYLKGGLAVAILAIGIAGWLLKVMLDSRWQSVLAALAALPKK